MTAKRQPPEPDRKNDPEAQSYELVPIDSIEPHPRNPRHHADALIEESVDINGFYGACYVQASTRLILSGEGRWDAAKAKGHARIPVIWLQVDDDRALRIMGADNRSSDAAGYDDVDLDAYLSEMAATDDGLDGTLWRLVENADEEAPDVEQVELKPMTRGHFLLSYPLDRHGAVAEVLRVLEDDPDIEMRFSGNNQ